MASIKCTNCGAVLKTQTEIPVGKKVKCPKCAQPFVVQAAAPEPAQPEPNPFATDDAAAGDDAKKPAGKKKSKTGLIIGIIVAALLLCCCCPSVGGGIWYYMMEGGINFGKEVKKDKDAPKEIPKDKTKEATPK